MKRKLPKGEEYEALRQPVVAARKGYIDDIIMPHSARKRIARPSSVKTKNVTNPAKKHDNIPL